MPITTFVYGGEKYPIVVERDGGGEKLLILYPEPTGDYVIAEVDSFGVYKQIEEVGQDEVQIIVA